jgi:hypothetical protein
MLVEVGTIKYSQNASVQHILLYGSSIWELTEQRLINNVQNRAAKIFLGVSKRTSNVVVH